MPDFSSTMADMIVRSRPQQAPGQTLPRMIPGPMGMKGSMEKTDVKVGINAGAIARLLGYRTPEEKAQAAKDLASKVAEMSPDEQENFYNDVKIQTILEGFEKAKTGYTYLNPETNRRELVTPSREVMALKASGGSKAAISAYGSPEARKNMQSYEEAILDKQEQLLRTRPMTEAEQAEHQAQMGLIGLQRQQLLSKERMSKLEHDEVMANLVKENKYIDARILATQAEIEAHKAQTKESRDRATVAINEYHDRFFVDGFLNIPVNADISEEGMLHRGAVLAGDAETQIKELAGIGAPDQNMEAVVMRYFKALNDPTSADPEKKGLLSFWKEGKYSKAGDKTMEIMKAHVSNAAEVLRTYMDLPGENEEAARGASYELASRFIALARRADDSDAYVYEALRKAGFGDEDSRLLANYGAAHPEKMSIEVANEPLELPQLETQERPTSSSSGKGGLLNVDVAAMGENVRQGLKSTIDKTTSKIASSYEGEEEAIQKAKERLRNKGGR